MTGHRLIDIHCGKGRNIKAGQPHIHNDSDFKRRVVVFELSRHIFFVSLIADHFTPLFGVVVALRHDNCDLFRPSRTQFQNPLVYLHGDGAGVGNNHRLSGQNIGAIVFIMVENIVYQRTDRLVGPQNCLHLAKFFFALFDNIRIGILCHQVILIVNKMQRLFIKLEMDDAAFIVNRSGRSILNCLSHIVNVDIITEHLTGAAVFRRDRCASKANICSVRERITDDSGSTDDGLGLNLAVFLLAHYNFLC